jgi:UDP-N-acetylglucosamine 2-epimerase (non-hydrolysing)
MQDKKIFAFFGTRPEAIKILPLKRILKDKLQLIHIEQHTTLAENICAFDGKIKIEDENPFNRLNNVFANIFKQDFRDCDYILVQGDTASVCAVSLAAFNSKKKVIYLESGLRTYNLESPYPEEGYRQITARISDIHFCPTQIDLDNLEIEKVGGKKFIVGNTSLDNLIGYKGLQSYEDEILVTLHRRENLSSIKEYFQAISILAKKYKNLKFTIPLHPNPEVQKNKEYLTGVNICEPMEHKDLINLILKCKLIITDSGGIQEEGSFLDKRCLVCRNTTERPDFPFHVMCPTPEDLIDNFSRLIDKNEWFVKNHTCPFGDGNASQKIVDILEKEGII